MDGIPLETIISNLKNINVDARKHNSGPGTVSFAECISRSPNINNLRKNSQRGNSDPTVNGISNKGNIKNIYDNQRTDSLLYSELNNQGELFNHDDQQIGFTELDRVTKRKEMTRQMVVNWFLVINNFISGFFMYSVYIKLKDDAHDEADPFIFRMGVIFTVLMLLAALRICKSFYIRRQWMNRQINPTLIESKLEFYSFFTLGLAQCGLSIYTIQFIIRVNLLPDFIEWCEQEEVDWLVEYYILVLVNIFIQIVYMVSDAALYLFKALLLVLAYFYFKFYGAFDKNRSPPSHQWDSMFQQLD